MRTWVQFPGSPRTLMCQEWIDRDPLRKRWWGRPCPNAGADGESHHLCFSLHRHDSLRVRRVWCFECGTLEEARA